MKTSALSQSTYYNPAFNSAIFDGPVRIYFSQAHEGLALKLYFILQQNFSHEISMAKKEFRRSGKNVFVLLYPTAESFECSFSGAVLFDGCAIGKLDQDWVVGVKGPEMNFEAIAKAIVQTLDVPLHISEASL